MILPLELMDEAVRLEVLQEYEVLDTPPEQALDDLASLAALICGTPMAAVSLVDADRQWFKAQVGLEVAETPRSVSFCAHALRQRELLIVPDATQDPRFAQNPLVTGKMGIRSYVGAPLVTPEGAVLGTLCVIDRVPRTLTAEQKRALQILQREVMTHLELRRRRRDLQASEADRANILASALDGIIIIDAAGRICDFNPAAEQIFGYARGEVLGRTLEETIVPPELRAQHREGLSRYLRTGEQRVMGERIEITALRADGTAFPVELSIVRSPEAEPPRFIGFLRDITARRQAEEALRESEGRFQLAVRGSAAAIWDWDILTGALYFSSRYLEMLGYSEGELPLQAQAFFDLVHPEDQSRVQQAAAAHLSAERRRYDVEVRLREKTGQYRWFRVTGQAVYDEDGHAYRMAGSTFDIMRQKEAELALQASEAQLLAAQMVAKLGSWEIDLADLTMVWSAETHRIFETDPDRFHPTYDSGLSIIHPDDRAAVERAFAESLAQQAPGKIEHRLLLPGGRIKFVEQRWQTIKDEQGKLVRALGTCQDITERRQLEQQFLRAQRMESIGTLAGGIAHDLNNVLGPIITSLELLQMRFPDPASQELLSIISSSARRGADMVSQVLSFARGVEGRRMEVQVRHVIHDIEKIASEAFPKHIRIRATIPPDLWTIVGDPTQLHQVLLNLCLNARDALPHGGTLTMSAENVTLDAHYCGSNLEAKPGPYVCVQIEDSGTGIPPEVIEKIFDPFFTTKEVGKGTGLGLSTSLAIVKSHGGFIRTYSEVGKGTQFKVYLPAQPSRASAAVAERAAETPRGNGEMILVVDDEVSIRQVTRRTLEAFGYRVLLAADGAEAVAIYASHSAEIAAVLTDMMMPVMDGPATIQVLRQMNPTVPIIAASGLAANNQLAGLDVKDFLPKPYTAEKLLQIVKKVLVDGA